MDNAFDQRLLDTFLNKIFTAKSFDGNFSLAKPDSSAEITAPEGTKPQDFQNWVVKQLPNVQKPSFMGLPDNAETVLLAARGRDMIRKCLLGMTKEQETAKLHLDGQAEAFLRPAWMSSLLNQAQLWLNQLPKPPQMPMLDPRDPLARYFTREINSGVKLLKKVMVNIKEVIDVCEGRMKQTNETRALCDSLTKQLIPAAWQKYKYRYSLSLI
jgi:dynein heavy chain 1